MFLKRICAIAACDAKGTIGKEGKLPWHSPEDLRHFSDVTRGQVMIMGRNTFESLPKRHLEGGVGIVFTRQAPLLRSEFHLHFVSSLEQLFGLMPLFEGRSCYLIGGAQMYKFFLEQDLIAELLLTQFHGVYEGDIFFPLGQIAGWSRTLLREEKEFTICRYLGDSSFRQIGAQATI